MNPRRDDQTDIRWLAVRNDSGEEIPAYAAMMLTGDLDDDIPVVDQPDADDIDPAFILINGPAAIPVDGDGAGTRDAPMIASAPGAASGDSLGTQEDDWELGVGRRGFFCQAAVDSDLALVVQGDGGREMELCRVWFAAVTSGGIDYYAAKFNELDAAGNTWDEGPIVGATYDCFLVQRFDIALTVGSGSGGGCYLAKRDGETKTLTVDSVEYTLPVYVTTEYPAMMDDCTTPN